MRWAATPPRASNYLFTGDAPVTERAVIDPGRGADLARTSPWLSRLKHSHLWGASRSIADVGGIVAAIGPRLRQLVPASDHCVAFPCTAVVPLLRP